MTTWLLNHATALIWVNFVWYSFLTGVFAVAGNWPQAFYWAGAACLTWGILLMSGAVAL